MEKKTDTLFASLLGIFMFFVPVNANAQNHVGNLSSPSSPTQIEVRERTISDLLYFPFTCIEDPMTTREQAWQVVTDIFGNCESINLYPGLHAGVVFDFTYRGTPIGICNYDWYDNRTWYDFFLKLKTRLISSITISSMTYVVQASRSLKTICMVVCRTARSLFPSSNG